MTIQHKPLMAWGWLRTITCFVFFLVLYVAVSAGAGIIAGKSTGEVNTGGGSLLWGVVVVNLCFFLSAYLFRRYADRKPFLSLGFQWQGRYAMAGLLTAFMVIGIGTLVLWAINHLKFTGVAFAPGALLNNLLIFVLVAFGEELFFRGYLLNNLLQSFNKWWALAFSALLFTLVHIQNPGATATLLPVLMVFTGGLLFGINYIYTKNLWFSICLHFAWNFLQGPVLGYDVSGMASKPIFTHTITGPAMITGGVFGYEGSIFCLLLSIAATAVLAFAFSRKKEGQY